MPKNKRQILLIAGIAFHASIAIMMGLISFGLAMSAALVLYLCPVEKEFAFPFRRLESLKWTKHHENIQQGNIPVSSNP